MKRRSRSFSVAIRVIALLPVIASMEVCGGGAVVDGDCANGYVERNGTCIAVSGASMVGGAGPGSSPGGGSGRDGSAGDSGFAGRGGTATGGNEPGGGAGGNLSNGGAGNTGVGGGGTAAGGKDSGGSAGSTGTGGSGTGGSGNGGAAGANPGGGQGGSGGAFACTPPLVDCGECVDTNVNPSHCGQCDRSCGTGVCQQGVCVTANAGHEIMIGMDYASVSSTTGVNPLQLLGNAVFYNAPSSSGAWRVLGYDPAASPTRAAVDAVIQQQASGRVATASLSFDLVTDSATARSRLNIQSFEAFVLYDEPTAPTGALGQAGGELREVLQAFASAGGCLVILGGGTGTNEAWSFVQAAQLLPATGMALVPTSSLPSATLKNVLPSDGAARNVNASFAARANTAYWQVNGVGNEAVIVWQTGSPTTSFPVVIHRTVSPP